MKHLLFLLVAGAVICAVAREKVILDTDIGGDVDDALALAYLVAEPECELLGVTIAGWNGSAPKQAEIASALIKSYGRDVPVKIGPGITMAGGKKFSPNPKKPPRYWPAVKDLPRDRFTLSNDAVDFMNRTIRANPGEITLVSVGHLTNMGVLFTAYPDVAAKLKRLVVMGGNLKGGVEWNALQDPVATATAFGNGNGSFPPVTLVIGSEVTGPKHIPPAEARAWMAGVPAMEILAKMAEYWYREGHDLYFHDPAAAMAVFHPEICTWTNGTVTVDVKTSRMTMDKTPNPERALLTYATSFDIVKFRQIFKETLVKWK